MEWAVAVLDRIRVWVSENWQFVSGILASVLLFFIGLLVGRKDSRTSQRNFDKLYDLFMRKTGEWAGERIAAEKSSGNPPGVERVKQIVTETVEASSLMTGFDLSDPAKYKKAFAFEGGDGTTWLTTTLNLQPRPLTERDKDDWGADLLWVRFSPPIGPETVIRPAPAETIEHTGPHSVQPTPLDLGNPNPDERPKKKA